MRAGDDSAFDAIYDRYHRGLLAFCRHMLGSRHEAEDVLQQSFASAYLTLRRGTDDVALRPWLYTIARNRCLSEMRTRREHLDVAAIAPGASSLEGLAAEVQRRSDLRDLVEDVQRLREDQRAALVLFELGDHSHEAIAEVLGVRREKVKALVFQAREGLMRARRARETPCAEIRAELATLRGKPPRRSILGIHLDRCPDCAAYDVAVRRQRRALAVILPVAPTAGLKATVLASTLGGGAAAVGGAGAADRGRCRRRGRRLRRRRGGRCGRRRWRRSRGGGRGRRYSRRRRRRGQLGQRRRRSRRRGRRRGRRHGRRRRHRRAGRQDRRCTTRGHRRGRRRRHANPWRHPQDAEGSGAAGDHAGGTVARRDRAPAQRADRARGRAAGGRSHAGSGGACGA